MPRYDPLTGSVTPVGIIRDGHADMLAREEYVGNQITQAWERGVSKVKPTLGVIVEALKGVYSDDGYQIGPGWLMKNGYTQRVQRNTIPAMDEMANASLVYVNVGQRDAILRGLSDAQSATEAAMQAFMQALKGQWSYRPADDALKAFEGKASNGSPLSDLFQGFGQDLAMILQQTLEAGLASGTNPREIARQLEQDLNIPRQRARVIARNEMVDAYRQAALAGYQENSDVLDGWAWCADLGPRTCAMCIDLNGQTFPLDEPFDSHACCRCAPIPITKGWDDLSDSLDLSDFSDEEIADLEDMDFSNLANTRAQLQNGADWFARQNEKIQQQILGKGKQILYKAGKLTLTDLVGKGTDEQWGGYRYEKSLKELGFDGDDIADAKRDLANTSHSEQGHTVIGLADPDVIKELKKLLPNVTLTPDDVANMVGAPPGAEVHIFTNYPGYVSIEFQTPDGISAERSFARDDSGALYMSNDQFGVPDELQGHGIGVRVFAQEVETLAKMGFSSIETIASGGGMNGYYTWPRLGYIGELDTADIEHIHDDIAAGKLSERFQDATTIQDLMAGTEGRAWWKENGGGIHVSFDLSDGSLSRQILHDYLIEKGIIQPDVPADFFDHEGPNAATSSKRLTSLSDLAQAHGADLATELKSYTLAQLKAAAKVEAISLSGKTKAEVIASIANHFAPPKGEETTGEGVASVSLLSQIPRDELLATQQRLKTLLNDPNETPGETKARIVRELSDQVRGDATWQAMLERTRDKLWDSGSKDPTRQVIGYLIDAWAKGNNNLYYGIQHAIADEFGIDAAMGHLDAAKYEEYLDRFTDASDGLRKFVRAMYDHTQAWFREQGITEVPIYRGMNWDEGEGPSNTLFNGQYHKAEITLQPASSFSADPDVASLFSGSSASPKMLVIADVIPVKDILGTSMTGFGAKDETELIVLGGKREFQSYGENIPTDQQNKETLTRLKSQVTDMLIAPEHPAEAPTPPDLAKMKVADLRALAKEQGIDLTGATKKADILARLQGGKAAEPLTTFADLAHTHRDDFAQVLQQHSLAELKAQAQKEGITLYGTTKADVIASIEDHFGLQVKDTTPISKPELQYDHDTLSKMSLAELKTLAKSIGLQSAGVAKDALIERLAQHYTLDFQSKALDYLLQNYNPYASDISVSGTSKPPSKTTTVKDVPLTADQQHAIAQLHAQADEAQQQQHLPRELKPDESIPYIAQRLTEEDLARYNPYAPPMPEQIVEAYGEQGLGAKLNDYSVTALEKIADAYNDRHPNQPIDLTGIDQNHDATLSKITSTVTDGRYSADFAPTETPATTPDLSKMKVAELRTLAAQEGVSTKGLTKKADLVAALQAHYNGAEVPKTEEPTPARSQADLPPISDMPKGQSSAIESWLNDNRPDQTWHVADVHPDLLPDVVSTLDRMQQAYPDAHFHLEEVTTEGDWTGKLARAYAYVDPDGHTLHLNPAAFGDNAEFVDHYRYDATHADASGRTWLVPVEGLSPVEAIITHEFGHVVDSYLHYSKDAFTDVVSSGGLGKIGTTWDRLRTKLLPLTYGKLSQYADTNSNEMFAETFVLMHGTAAQKGVIGDNVAALQAFLDLVFGSDTHAPGDFQGLGDITDSEERRKAEAMLRELAFQLDLPYP